MTSTSSTGTSAPTTTSAPRIIEGSIPVEMWVPRLNASVSIASSACPVVDGMLDPARDQMMTACYYTAADKPYRLPGSNADDVVVLAGHTWRHGEAAFNFLWDWQAAAWSVRVGDELWLRTQASGDAWLVYRAVSLHTPDKHGGLANDASIWGTGPLPNRLLTIGCLQPNDHAKRSSQNVVVAWDFVRVANR